MKHVLIMTIHDVLGGDILRGMAVMAAMAAMAARQVMVRSERIVVCRLWSLMLIRRKRVGVRQCGGDGEGGRAGAGESSGVMRARAMMATMAAIAAMAGDSERRVQREEPASQQAASAHGRGPRGGEEPRRKELA